MPDPFAPNTAVCRAILGDESGVSASRDRSIRVNPRSLRCLDRPVWATLTTAHASISVGDHLARKFAPEYSVFASTCDESTQALAALAALVQPGEHVHLLQTSPVTVPQALVVGDRISAVQMIATSAVAVPSGVEPIVMLGERDAPEMIELARLSEPGPFRPRTYALGGFLGVRVGRRLVAMAGERFRFPGHTEVSAVCTHPDFRGRGFARRLTAAVAAHIQQRGEQPFLHARATNSVAIRLYAALGFTLRTEVDIVHVRRAQPR